MPRNRAAIYLLAGLVTCAECGESMYRSARKADPGQRNESYIYRCDKGHNFICGLWLDELVRDRVLEANELLVDVDVGVGSRVAGEAARIAELEAKVNGIQEMLDDIWAAYRAGKISSASAFDNVAKLETARDEFQAQRNELQRVQRAAGRTELTRESWDALEDPGNARRRVVVAKWIQKVLIKRARGVHVTADRVGLVWQVPQVS